MRQVRADQAEGMFFRSSAGWAKRRRCVRGDLEAVRRAVRQKRRRKVGFNLQAQRLFGLESLPPSRQCRQGPCSSFVQGAREMMAELTPLTRAG